MLAVGLNQKNSTVVDALRNEIAELYLDLRVDVKLWLLDAGYSGACRVQRCHDDGQYLGNTNTDTRDFHDQFRFYFLQSDRRPRVSLGNCRDESAYVDASGASLK